MIFLTYMVQGTPSDTATMILAELARQANMVDYFSGGGGWILTHVWELMCSTRIQPVGKGLFPAILPHCFLGAFVLRKENQAFPCSERELLGVGGRKRERERSKRVPMTRENLPATPV